MPRYSTTVAVVLSDVKAMVPMGTFRGFIELARHHEVRVFDRGGFSYINNYLYYNTEFGERGATEPSRDLSLELAMAMTNGDPARRAPQDTALT